VASKPISDAATADVHHRPCWAQVERRYTQMLLHAAPNAKKKNSSEEVSTPRNKNF